jgi:MDMPI C-terminal domain
VFNAASDDRTGGEFWLSSLLNESVIHGADAAYAAGRDIDVDADIAADLITNHLAMLTSPTWAARRPESASALRGAGETLRWHASDEPGLGEAGDWFIERSPDGASWEARSGEADVYVSGPAKSLLLILTRRRQLTDEADHVTVDGDLDLVRHWLENSAHVAD